MAISLPNPGIVFVPLDVLTAEQLNQIVQNIDTLAELFPLKAAQIGANAVGTTQLNNGAVTATKIDWSALAFSESTDNTQTTLSTANTNILSLDVSSIPTGATFLVFGEYVFNSLGDDTISVIADMVYGSATSMAASDSGAWTRTISIVGKFTKTAGLNSVYFRASKDKTSPVVRSDRGYMCAFRVG